MCVTAPEHESKQTRERFNIQHKNIKIRRHAEKLAHKDWISILLGAQQINSI